jgi:hypothetical protein
MTRSLGGLLLGLGLFGCASAEVARPNEPTRAGAVEAAPAPGAERPLVDVRRRCLDQDDLDACAEHIRTTDKREAAASVTHMARILRGGCAKGDALSCERVGLLLAHGSRDDRRRDDERAELSRAAERQLTRACSIGRGQSCYYLGMFLRDARASKGDITGAMQRACDLGSPDGCRALGDASISKR